VRKFLAGSASSLLDKVIDTLEMIMRRLVWITVAVVALAGAGMAVAHDGFGTKSVTSVSATFSATSASVVKTSTCTGSDGTYASTRATYTGAAANAAGDPNLGGPITLDTQSLVNTTTGVGTMSGRLRIGSSPSRVDAQFDAVISNGNVVGLAEGHAQDPHSQLIANISASYTATGGFVNGFIGHGAGGGDAVETAAGGCRPTPTPKPDTIVVRGAVSGVPGTTITAAGVTCTIPSSLAASVAALKLVAGSQVEMTCTASGGTNTLVKISAGHNDGKDSSKGGDKH
jgi:hypothetical protein